MVWAEGFCGQIGMMTAMPGRGLRGLGGSPTPQPPFYPFKFSPQGSSYRVDGGEGVWLSLREVPMGGPSLCFQVLSEQI